MHDESVESIDFQLIDSGAYRRLYPFLAAAFMVSSILSFVLWLPFIWIFWLGAVSLLIPVFMQVYTLLLKEKGRLSIDTRNILIVQKPSMALVVPISILDDLKISRGATIHKDENSMFSPETHDNWISFTFNQRQYKFEFSILDKAENEKFELLISRLRAMYPKLYYESI